MARYTLFVPAGTSTTFYIPVYEKCTVLGGYVAPGGTPGASATVTITSGSTDVGVATVGATDAAGSTTAITMDSTLATRKTAFTTAIPMKIVATSTNSISWGIVIDTDEAVRMTD